MGNTSAFSDVLTDTTGYYLLFSGFCAGKMYVVGMKQGYHRILKKVSVIRGDTVVCDLELPQR